MTKALSKFIMGKTRLRTHFWKIQLLQKKLNVNNAVQDSGIPVKILKENADFFAEYTYL